MFNIHVNNGINEAPEDDIYYIVAKEGIFLRKKLGVMDSIAPVKNISTLQSVATSARMHISKIPAPSFAKVVDFFKKVYEEHRGEAVVLLFYNQETHKHRIVPPYQKVTSTSIEYNRGMTIEGWTMIGTIHSHAAMSAFHSGTDQGDEESMDGLHITIGNVSSEDFSISASIVVNGHRVIVDPEEYINGIKKVSEIDEETPYYSRQVYKYDKGKLVLNEEASKRFVYNRRKFDKRYRCLASPSKSICNPKWLSLVEKGTYTYSWKNRQNYNYGRFGQNYRGYGSGFDPHAWHEHNRNLPATTGHHSSDIKGKQLSLNLQERNQIIIDSLNLDDENLPPCLTCKHREEKILIEEDDIIEEYLFICTQCDKLFTETDLENNEESDDLICPVCKTGDHFTVVDESELESKYEKMSETELTFMNQPDQDGFFTCKNDACQMTFLKISTDVECPYCQTPLVEIPDSTEERLTEQQRNDSGTYLNSTEKEQQEILKQAAKDDKNLERIPDPEKDSVPVSKNSLMGMFKRVFKSEKI
ncbi:MAG: Mov34/MPN/PAD-1 family protein [Candidatus Thorarchaeota archaeon]